MKLHCLTLLAALSLFPLASGPALAVDPPDGGQARDVVVLVIRHAEKPTPKDPSPQGGGKGDLSVKGQERANKYADYFGNYKLDGQADPLAIGKIFATAIKPEGNTHSDRPRETVEPTAKKLNLPIDNSFQDEDYAKVADQIMKGDFNHKNVLICWHHGKIPELLQALHVSAQDIEHYFPPNAEEPGKKNPWPDKVFCWLFELRYDADGVLTVTPRNVNLRKSDAEYGLPPFQGKVKGKP